MLSNNPCLFQLNSLTPFSLHFYDHLVRHVVFSQETAMLPESLAASERKMKSLGICPTILAFFNLNI